jgi:hypothetical protein
MAKANYIKRTELKKSETLLIYSIIINSRFKYSTGEQINSNFGIQQVKEPKKQNSFLNILNSIQDLIK